MDTASGVARFHPTRAGIVNLWDYRDDEFVFAGGRLVLRGPNGSGKTKALEVLFPFVLDGRIEPRRLNPFASEDRTMRSNLLYRGQSAGYGYVWMEFATARGEAVTVGIGLQASKHHDRVKRWYFVTDGRVGIDFSLLTGDDRPLTRAQLVAELGTEVVTDTPSEHRAAVDARLFGLGRERYDQLVALILTLRRPQLAKNLDPVSLSRTLSDGLRPLDDHLLVEAARSFDDMESVAATLDGLVRADEAAATFLSAYTAYLRVQSRTAADAVTVRREAAAVAAAGLADAHRDLGDAQQAHAAADERVTQAQLDVVRSRGRLDNLRASDGYRAHQQLDAERKLVETRRGEAKRAHARAADARSRRGSADSALSGAERVAAERSGAAQRIARDLADDAAAAGIGWSVDDAEADGLDERVQARVAHRDDDLLAVRDALARHVTAERSRRDLSGALDEADALAEAARLAEQQAQAALEQARATVRRLLAAWADRHAATVDELAVTGLLEALAATIDDAGAGEGTDPRTVFADRTASALQTVRDELARQRGLLRTCAEELASREQQRRLIADECDDSPPPAAARTADRDGRAGAPLWRLVRFRDGVDDGTAAAVEAGLEAAALLDAWVHPDPDAATAALTAGEHDAYLVALPQAQRPTGDTLASVLEVDESSEHGGAGGVPAVLVRDVLASVALLPVGTVPEPGTVTVSRAGRFGQGIQVGAYAKDAAGYIGATARAHRRAERLAELDAQIRSARAVLDDIDRLIKRATGVLAAVAAATEELPRLGGIVAAARTVAEAAGALRAAGAAADSARARLDTAIAELSARERDLRRTEAHRGLLAVTLPEVDAAVRRFARAGTRLVGGYEHLAGALRSVEAAADHREDAAAAESVAVEEARTAAMLAAEQQEAWDTLQRTVGADAQQVVAEITATEAELATAEGRQGDALAAREQATGAVAGAERMCEAGAVGLRTALIEQQATARALEPFADEDVLRLLRCPAGLRWPARRDDWPDPADGGALPDEVVALHQAVLAATGDLRPTDATLKQATTRVTRAFDELTAELSAAGHDHRPEWDNVGGIIAVRVAEESGPVAIGAFAERIGAARRDQEQLLTESERRVLEDALLTELARQIHARTVDARDLISGMNTEMRRRRMSSGITVGVRWELADGLAEEHRGVVRLLERDAAALGPDDLARLRAHFAAGIKLARAARPDRAYRELLGEVLDYRRWRSFAFHLHPAGGGEERLTRARHGQLSGGEQSVSLHLPLFAAAHAMFDSADPACPRLLALDEAFAGVDDTGRTELFGLSTEFDFDLIMTGYDLWATYATVPSAAHYDLAHSAAEHAVSALLIVWDGQGRDADVDGELAATLGSPSTRRRPGRRDGLLDVLDPDGMGGADPGDDDDGDTDGDGDGDDTARDTAGGAPR